MAANQASKVNLDARMAAAAASSGIHPGDFQNNENTSGGLASFLQDNLLLSDVNLNKNGGLPASMLLGMSQNTGYGHGLEHQNHRMVGEQHSPIKPFVAHLSSLNPRQK